MAFVTLVPAYGRDYTSAAQVKKDWDAQKDFIIQSIGHHQYGRYINKQQTESKDTYNIRYKRLTNVVVIKGGNTPQKIKTPIKSAAIKPEGQLWEAVCAAN